MGQTLYLPAKLIDQGKRCSKARSRTRSVLHREVEYPIEAYRMLGCDIGADRGLIWPPRGAYTYEGQLAKGLLLLPCLEVDIRQSIELVEDNIDIVRTDTVTDDADPLTSVEPSDRVELSAGDIALDVLEATRHHIDTGGITDEKIRSASCSGRR